MEHQEKVLTSIDEEELIELAKELAKMKSFSGEETPVAEFLAKYLENRGFEVEVQEVQMGRKQVIGRLRGTGGGGSLMFNGHIDTDMVCGDWTKDPWKPVLEEGRLYGMGLTNMKAGVAAMIAAADAVRIAGVELKGDLIIAAVDGELQGGTGTRHMLKEGITADMAVVPEPTNLQLATVFSGATEWMIHVKGKSAHITWLEGTVNAIVKMAKVIDALTKMRFSYEPRKGWETLPRMNIGVIRGGVGRTYEDFRPPIVPDFCTITVATRFIPGMTTESIRKDFERVLDELKAKDPELEYEIEQGSKLKGGISHPIVPPFDVPIDEYIVQKVKQIHTQITGKEPVVGSIEHLREAFTDGNWLWKAEIPTVVYGPGWSEYNKPDEYVELDQMVTCTKVLALTALDVCTKTREEIKRH